MNKPVRERLRAVAPAYLGASVLCAVIANVYALFGHSVRSQAMDFMFLYPLCAGLAYLLTAKWRGKRHRFGFNLYNSGIAALVAAALLQGIFEIAGTASSNVFPLRVAGWAMAVAGYIILLSRT